VAGELLATNGDVQIGTGNTTTQTVLCSALSAGRDPSLAATYANVWVANNFNPNSGFDMLNLDIQRVGQPGLYTGADTPTSRRLEFDLWINASSQTQLTNTITALNRAMAPRSSGYAELAFQASGTKYVLYGRYRGFENTSPERYGLVNNRRIQRWRIRFLATDPYIFLATPTTFNLQSVAGGTYDQGAPPVRTSGGTFTPTVSHTVLGEAQPRWQLSIPASHANPLINTKATNASTTVQFENGLYWLDTQGTQSTAFTVSSWDRSVSNSMGRLTGAASKWPVLTPGTTSYWYYGYNNTVMYGGGNAGLVAGTAATATMTYWPAYYMIAI
jgi:hypothetical protein